MTIKKNHIVASNYPFYDAPLRNTFTKVLTKYGSLPTESTTITTPHTVSSSTASEALKPQPRLKIKLDINPVKELVACQNGGYLIDGICLCINGFTGTECELAPPQKIQQLEATEKTSTTTSTRSIIIELKNKIKDEIAKFRLSQESSAQEMPLQVENPTRSDELTVITINRKGREGRKC